MRWALILILLTVTLGKALACMCGGDTDLKNYSLEGYDVIFLGELIDAKYFPKIKINETTGFAAEVDSFKILKVWKGNIKAGQRIAVHQFGIGCTNSLLEKDGKSLFIIAATRNTQIQKGFHGIDKFLQTSLCDPIIDKGKDIDAFQKATHLLDSRFTQVDFKEEESEKHRSLISPTLIFSALALAILIVVIGLTRKRRVNNPTED